MTYTDMRGMYRIAIEKCINVMCMMEEEGDSNPADIVRDIIDAVDSHLERIPFDDDIILDSDIEEDRKLILKRYSFVLKEMGELAEKLQQQDWNEYGIDMEMVDWLDKLR